MINGPASAHDSRGYCCLRAVGPPVVRRCDILLGMKQRNRWVRGAGSVMLATAALVTALGGNALARTANTTRILGNIDLALNNVAPDDKLINAPIAERDQQTAVNLLRDADSALSRAQSSLPRVSPEDQNDPDVVALKERVATLVIYRDKLAKNLAASKASGSALDAKYRAFREQAKPFADGLRLFPESSGSAMSASTASAAQLTKALAQLAQLDTLCTTTYAGIVFNDRLAFQLAFDPIKVCATAANRQALATTLVTTGVENNLARWIKDVDSSRTTLASNDGFVAISGNVMNDLIFDRPKAKADMLALHQPLFVAIGATVPADLFSKLDAALDVLWAELDRLAPTYAFPSKTFSDAGAVNGAKKALTNMVKGAKVIRAAMLFPAWDIAKNGLDIPTERYRTGGILFKSSAKITRWCQYRSFTAHQTYTGGGRYASTSTYTFAGLRLQACK